MTSAAIEIARSVADVRAAARRWRAAGERIALVPTMGALHEGHLALVRLARERRRRAVASIFVNPRQFGPAEDFARYPRDEAADVAKLAPAGCDLVWIPPVEAIYPDGFVSRVEMGGPALGLEADVRPHHFGGVATVCLKLFSAVAPDIAVFGEKDYQQLCVIRRLVRDFDLPLEIVGAPTVREADGLALSSRNAYLSTEERAAAPSLYRALRDVAGKARRGEDIAAARRDAERALIGAGFSGVDYIEVRDAQTLGPPPPGAAVPLRVLAAARLGKTRLIDNVEL